MQQFILSSLQCSSIPEGCIHLIQILNLMKIDGILSNKNKERIKTIPLASTYYSTNILKLLIIIFSSVDNLQNYFDKIKYLELHNLIIK